MKPVDVEKDIVKDDLKYELRWTRAENVKFPYSHHRALPEETAQKAIDYIAIVTQRYPVQIRYKLALDHWERFAQQWCDTGNELESLKVI